MKELTGPILLAGAPVNVPDLEYASGFRAPDPVVVLRNGDACLLVVSELEAGRARRTARSPFRGSRLEVFTPQMLGLRGAARGRLADWALAAARRAGVRRVTVAGSFPLGVAERLRKAGVRVRVAPGVLFPERDVKSADEVRKITESQQAAVLAMRAAIRLIAATDIERAGFLMRKGRRLSAEDVQLDIQKILLEHGCLCREVIVACGRDSADPHERGSGALRAHEPIVIDIFPQHMEHGYWGDITRTVVRGRAPARLRRMYQAVRAAQSAALACVGPRIKGSRVHAAAAEELERRGFRTERGGERSEGFIHGTGHGVGLAIHESPVLGLSDNRLRAGNIVTVEPGLYYPDIGGIRIEDTVLVTPGGWRYLVPCEKRFEI